MGFVLGHKRLCCHGGLETVDSQHIDSESFSSQHVVGFMSANVGLTLKQHWANFLLEYYPVISSVTAINAVKVYSIG